MHTATEVVQPGGGPDESMGAAVGSLVVEYTVVLVVSPVGQMSTYAAVRMN